MFSSSRVRVAGGYSRSLLLVVLLVGLLPQLSSAANKPPVISGTPPTTATVGKLYSFTAKATDPDGSYVGFGISNQPSWATFDRTTGTLKGTPTKTGTYTGVKIYAWDGVSSAALPLFTITVKAATSNLAPTI
ncbi:MAG TPA: putative Ig domain-containing protein, partial [Povalibacter sp.]